MHQKVSTYSKTFTSLHISSGTAWSWTAVDMTSFLPFESLLHASFFAASTPPRPVNAGAAAVVVVATAVFCEIKGPMVDALDTEAELNKSKKQINY